MFKNIKSVATFGLLALAVVAAPAMAADGGIDTSSVTSVISDALVAVAAIGAGFLGFKYLKKVWARL